jgi:hypothetical protein
MAKRAAKAKSDFIRIGGYPWQIVIEPGLCDEEKGLVQGETDVVHRIIKLNGDLPPHIQLQTLWHECIHAALYITGKSELMDHMQEEALVLALEYSLYPLIPEIMNRAVDL